MEYFFYDVLVLRVDGSLISSDDIFVSTILYELARGKIDEEAKACLPGNAVANSKKIELKGRARCHPAGLLF